MMRWTCRACSMTPDWSAVRYQGFDKWYNRPQPERNPDKLPRRRKAKRGWRGDAEDSQDEGREQWHS
eukprot:3527603-Alexandrium_andersonii.AAC.1